MNRYIRTKIGLGLILISCTYHACDEKKLDLGPNAQLEQDYFASEEDMERTVIGVYAKLTDFYWFNNNSSIHGFWQLPGDDITTKGNFAFEVFSTLASDERDVSYYYRTAYQMVNRANTALEKIEEAGAKGVYASTSLQNYHRGEVLFLRSWVNFQLWNYFETSPLITQRSTTQNLTPVGSSGTQLLDQAIVDLQTAAGLLPAAWDEANRGRVTSNSANGLLGKALVYRATVTKSAADHTAAIAAFNRITGVSLVPDFGDNFSVKAENNSESLFEYQASSPGFDNVWLPNDFNNSDGSLSAYWGWYEGHWSLFGAANTPFIATKKLISAFDPNDPRLPLTADPKTQSVKKYVSRDQKSGSGVGSVNNPRLLRYADVLLLKAEALMQSGGSAAEAIGLINQVRTRARNMVAGGTAPANYNTGESNPATIMSWIMNERFLELAGEEGIRWQDLRRWHLSNQINLGNFDFSSESGIELKFDPNKNLLYPIPLGEIDLNPNVRQNQGY